MVWHCFVYFKVSDNLVDVKAANVSSQAEQDCKLDGFQKEIQEFYEKVLIMYSYRKNGLL